MKEKKKGRKKGSILDIEFSPPPSPQLNTKKKLLFSRLSPGKPAMMCFFLTCTVSPSLSL